MRKSISRNKIVLLTGVALFMSGCASTNAPQDLGKLEYTGFTEKSDGSVYQSVMGVTCPDAIDGMQRDRTNVYNDGGTDVSCNYLGEDRIFTVYLSRFKDDTLADNFRSSKHAVEYRYDALGYKYDEELSDVCSAASLDTASILGSLSGIFDGSNKTNEITISTSPSAVYINKQEGRVSLLVLEEMFEKDFHKTRYTGPYTSEAGVKAVCEMVRSNYIEMKLATSKSRGVEDSDTDRLSRFLGASGGT